jgi:hypothetical protein
MFQQNVVAIVSLMKVATTLNMYTGQNPRRPVVLIEFEPNAYNNYLSPTAGVILTFIEA